MYVVGSGSLLKPDRTRGIEAEKLTKPKTASVYAATDDFQANNDVTARRDGDDPKTAGKTAHQ